MDRPVDTSLASKRLAMDLLLGFAFCSAVLAAVRLCGVISDPRGGLLPAVRAPGIEPRERCACEGSMVSSRARS
jgi:hypothetical protein